MTPEAGGPARAAPSPDWTPGRGASRLAGLGIVGVAALLWFWLIPWQVDAADYGWMRPRTLPSICTVGLALFGLALVAFPGGSAAPTRFPWTRLAMLAALFALGFAALFAWGRLGFLVTAPILAALLVAALGERRPGWIAGAVVAVPLAIWLLVDQLLGRPLP